MAGWCSTDIFNSKVVVNYGLTSPYAIALYPQRGFVYRIVYDVQCTTYSIRRTLYTVQCILYTVHYTLYSAHIAFYLQQVSYIPLSMFLSHISIKFPYMFHYPLKLFLLQSHYHNLSIIHYLPKLPTSFIFPLLPTSLIRFYRIMFFSEWCSSRT